MPKIAVYAIAKNEAKHVQRWYDSIKDADGIFVLDTGSDDDTMWLLSACPKVSMFRSSLETFRFDHVRNHSLRLIPDEYEWAMFIDLDEVMEEGWYESMQRWIEAHPTANAINTRMIYTQNEDGTDGYTYNRLMAHKTQEFYWKYPVHEVLMPIEEKREYQLHTDIRVYHKPDPNKSRSNYLDLLILGVEEYPEDPRCTMYLAREYMMLEQFPEAIVAFERHLTIETNVWFRSEGYRYLAWCNEQLDQTREARDYYIAAIAEAPEIRESWGDAAAFFYRHNRFLSALGMVENMLDVEDMQQHTIIRNDAYYREWPMHMAALCYYRMGNVKLARSNIERALIAAPTNQRVIADALLITGALKEKTT